MRTGSPRDRGIYDDKLCFETYMKWGAAATHRKLREWCKQVGMVNYMTGRPSQMGAFWALWRYAMQNPEEGFPLYKEWWYHTTLPMSEFGRVNPHATFEDFLGDIQNHAYNNKSIASQSKYEAFCEKYGLPTLPPKFRMKEESTMLTLEEFNEKYRQNQEVSVEAGD